MSRYRLRPGWMLESQNGRVWYRDKSGYWAIERTTKADNARWQAVSSEGDSYQHKTLDGLTRIIEVADDRFYQRNNVQPRTQPGVPTQVATPGSDMDAAEFFCTCGRRYVVSLVPEASRIQDNGIRLRTKGLPLGRTVDLSIDG